MAQAMKMRIATAAIVAAEVTAKKINDRVAAYEEGTPTAEPD
jgi:hypothetical protein